MVYLTNILRYEQICILTGFVHYKAKDAGVYKRLLLFSFSLCVKSYQNTILQVLLLILTILQVFLLICKQSGIKLYSLISQPES